MQKLKNIDPMEEAYVVSQGSLPCQVVGSVSDTNERDLATFFDSSVKRTCTSEAVSEISKLF